jgi:hypothetical protein
MRHLSLYRAVVCGVCHVISRGCRWRGRCLRRREHGWLFVYEFSKCGLEMVHWDLGRQCKEAQKEEQQSIMINLGVSRVHFNAIRGCGSLVRGSLLTKNGPGWMTANCQSVPSNLHRADLAKIAY